MTDEKDNFDDLLKKHKESKDDSKKDTDKDSERSKDDKYKGRDKDSKRERDRSRDRDRERDKDRRGRDKSSEKDRDRDRRDRDRGKEYRRENRDRDRHGKDRDRDREERNRDRDGDRDRNRDRDRDRKRDRDERGRDEGSKNADRDEERTSKRARTERKSPSPDSAFSSEGSAHVSGGADISCSVEETNRLRLAAGLPPLLVQTKEELEAEQRAREEAILQAAKEREAQQIQAKLERSRRKRKLNKIEKGKSLGEELAEEDQGVLAWVSKSRSIQQEEKLRDRKQAEARAKMFEEQDEAIDGEDLKRVAIAHRAEDIAEGETILVLKDAPVLAEDDLNEETDELMNLNIAEKEKARSNQELKKKKRLYDVYGDEEFKGDEKGKSVLKQYDEEVEKPKLLVDSEGRVLDPTKRMESIREKLNKTKSKALYSLDTKPKLASEYLTAEEVAFKKTASEKKRKRRKVRKTKTMDLDEMEAAAAAEGTSDHGSRAAAVNLAKDKTELEKKKRQEGWAKAVEKARDHSESLYGKAGSKGENGKEKEKEKETDSKDKGKEKEKEGGVTIKKEKKDEEDSLATPMKIEGRVRKRRREEDELDIPDYDEDFYSSLATARKAVIPKKPPTSIAERVLSKVKKEKETSSQSSGDVSLVFTDTTEFVRALPTAPAVISQKKLNKRGGSVSTLPATTPLPAAMEEDSKEEEAEEEREEKKPASAFVEVTAIEEKRIMDAMETDDSTTTATASQPVIEEEPLVSGGMAATLALLNKKGAGKELESVSGRAKDKVLRDQNDRIRLERLDEFGRVMTPKEAFRVLSHKFHGKKPGKKKQEKRLKKYEEELKAKKMSSTDTPLMTAEALKKTQEATKQAYVVLSGASSARMDVMKNMPPPPPKEGKSKK